MGTSKPWIGRSYRAKALARRALVDAVLAAAEEVVDAHLYRDGGSAATTSAIWRLRDALLAAGLAERHRRLPGEVWLLEHGKQDGGGAAHGDE